MKFPKPIKKIESKYEKMLRYQKKARLKPKKVKKLKRIRLVPLPKLIHKLDSLFSKWIRNRDMDCVLKSPKCTKVLQCGHLIKRGKMSTRFSELNCHCQCSYHNYIHNQYPELYTNWFVGMYGKEAYDNLVQEAWKIKKWTREELQALIENYSSPF